MSNKVKELKLEIDKDTAKGQYTNMALIAHTKDEFILDFAFAYPGQSPIVNSRVITNPQHALAFLRSLEENISRYESKFGKIKEHSGNITREQN